MLLCLKLNIDKTQNNQGPGHFLSLLNSGDPFPPRVRKTKSIDRSAEDTKAPPPTNSFNHRSSTKRDSGGMFGATMSEFACRVLSRHVTSSNVLVIAPGAVSFAMHTFEEMNSRQIYSDDSGITQPDSIGTAFLRYGVAEGHTIHAINDRHPNKRFQVENSVPTLDDWWTSFDGDKSSNNDIIKNGTGSKLWWSSNPNEKPTWILLAVFDSEFGSEHSVWEKADSFLESCTVTYIVIAIHSVKLKDGSYRFGGLGAIESLLRRRYKLQTLSCSHYHAERNNEGDILGRYGPNALFQSAEQLKGFLRWGADASHSYGESTEDYFTSYIFATQGLDLAIPTPQTYLQYGGRGIDVFDEHDMKRLPPLKLCPEAKSKDTNFDFDEVSESSTDDNTSQ